MKVNTEKENIITNDDSLLLVRSVPFEDDEDSDCPSMLLFLSLLDCIPFDCKENKTESGV